VGRLLSQRTLNRTLLERQFLTGRTSRSPLEVIEHLAFITDNATAASIAFQ
jgi:hypothetical protein